MPDRPPAQIPASHVVANPPCPLTPFPRPPPPALQILKRINAEIEARRRAGEALPPPPKTAIAGPEYFGLNQPNVRHPAHPLSGVVFALHFSQASWLWLSCVTDSGQRLLRPGRFMHVSAHIWVPTPLWVQRPGTLPSGEPGPCIARAAAPWHADMLRYHHHHLNPPPPSPFRSRRLWRRWTPRSCARVLGRQAAAHGRCGGATGVSCSAPCAPRAQVGSGTSWLAAGAVGCGSPLHPVKPANPQASV